MSQYCHIASCLSYLVSSEEGDYYEETVGDADNDRNDEESGEKRDRTDSSKNAEENGERRNDTEEEDADNKKVEESEKTNKDEEDDEKTEQDDDTTKDTEARTIDKKTKEGDTSKDTEARTTDKKTKEGDEEHIQTADNDGEDKKPDILSSEASALEGNQRIGNPDDDVKSIDKGSD